MSLKQGRFHESCGYIQAIVLYEMHRTLIKPKAEIPSRQYIVLTRLKDVISLFL